MSQNRRTTFLGDRRVLFAYKLIWALASVTLVLFSAFTYLTYQVIDSGDALRLGPGVLYLLGVVTTLLTFSALGLAIYSVLHSHRLLGAAYRIQTSIRQVQQAVHSDIEKVPSVKLRDGDHLEPLAREVNDLVSTLVKHN